MEEKYFKERKEKFDDIFNDDTNDKIEQKLSLRKTKKNEILMSKRAKLLNDYKISVYEPEIDKQKLSNKILELYEEEKNINHENIEILFIKFFLNNK